VILEVPPLRSCVASARHWVLDRAAEAGVGDDTLAVVELLTSEVMTNAVVHGTTGGCVRIATSAGSGVFEVSVTDDGPGVPTVCHVAPAAEGGRGMLLVEALATEWGVTEHDAGKSVWFRIGHAGPEPHPAR
jgi:anti-sigma regulatory factor (Ser/Thr protein kinase)